MEPPNVRNRILDGVHNRGGPQFNQSSINAFYYNDSSASVPQRPRTVPRQESRLFTGRQDVAAKLAQAFVPTADSSPKLQRRFVISGLGGIGKSEICLKFASDHHDSYWGIFWIDCGNESKAKEGFQRIANICRLPSSEFEATKDFLSSSREKWLLILDNADDPKIDISKYLPSQKVGDVIITTRNKDLMEDYATVGSKELDTLDPDLARDLLLRAAGIASSSWQDKARAASAIVKELGGHALAILQAASFIKQACPIEDYLGLYYQQKDLLFKFSKDQESSTYKTVDATFEVSVLQLQESARNGDMDAKNALNLLDVLSFMHFEGAFEQIFTSAAAKASEIQKQDILVYPNTLWKLKKTHAKQLPNYFPTGQGSGSDLQWRRACNKLKIFSLIKKDEREGDSSSIDVHPLVHAWARERQDMATQSQSWYTASLALALACPDDKTVYDYKYELLRSHIRACFMNRKAEYFQNVEPGTTPSVLIHLLCAQWFLHEEYETDQLFALLESELRNESQHSAFSITKIKGGTFPNLKIHSKRKRVTSEDLVAAPENLEILGLYARYLDRRGDDLSALCVLQYIVEVQEETLDHGNRDLLASQHRLAGAYRSIGSYEMAIEILEHWMPRVPKFTVSDPLRLKFLDGLATAYRLSGQFQKAVSMCEEIVEIDKQTLETTDPRRLGSEMSLAAAYRMTYQDQKAIDLLEGVDRVQKEILHATHTFVLNTQYFLAQSYFDGKRKDDAIALLEKVIEADAQKPNNSIYLSDDLDLLARIYSWHGDQKKALELLKQASEVVDKSNIDIWHFPRLLARQKLAIEHQKIGDDGEAIKVLESTIHVEGRDAFDARNEKLIEICHQLVKAYRSNKQFEKADTLEKEIPTSEAEAKRKSRRGTRNPPVSEPSQGASPSQEANSSNPLCKCGNTTVRLITSEYNRNGNAGKPYWKCRNPKCLKWCGWAK